MAIDPQLSGDWTIDPTHSRIGFSSRHTMVSRVRGAFNDISGTVRVDAEEVAASRAEVTIRVESVDTRNADRDAHLLTPQFFDAEQFPTITFVSTHIDEVDEEHFIVTGDLTIRDITRQVSLPLEFLGVGTDHFGNVRAGLEGSRRIDRKDWGVTWNAALDSGGVLISDKISLEFELSLVKDGAPSAGQEPTGEQAADGQPAEERTRGEEAG
ncbi:MAG: YceI family protein [Pseudoclavibacter sp.]|nr:YceI family protein [Pseudoclavibacter sp.]